MENKIKFTNGSEIEFIHSDRATRGKIKEFYSEYINKLQLKWWQKIYLRIYGYVIELFWPYIRIKYRR